MRTIGFVMCDYLHGGTERVTDMISAALLRRGVCKIVLLAFRFTDQTRARATAIGYDVVELGNGDECEYHGEETTRIVADAVRRKSIDTLVMAIEPVPCVPLLRSLIPSGVRLILHLHSQPLWEVKSKLEFGRYLAKKSGSGVKLAKWYALKTFKENWLGRYSRRYKRVYRRVYSEVDGIVVLCDSYRRIMSGILHYDGDGDDFNVIPVYNPIDLGVYAEERCVPKEKEVLYVGRFSYVDKRVDRLVRIWKRVEDLHPEWVLKLVGIGPEEDSLRDLADELGLKNVRFCGYSADPREHYATASIFCLTSAFEGWGMVLVEAMASGVVPMAFDCSAGVHELLEDGRGVLVKPFDEEEYALRLAELMDNEDMRHGHTALYPDFVKRFDVGKVADEWIRIFGLSDAKGQ